MTKSKTAYKTTAQASSCKAHKRIHDYFRQAKPGTWSWNAFESFYNKKGDCSNGKASDHYAKSLDAISKFCDNKCFIESCRILATRLRKDFSTAAARSLRRTSTKQNQHKPTPSVTYHTTVERGNFNNGTVHGGTTVYKTNAGTKRKLHPAKGVDGSEDELQASLTSADSNDGGSSQLRSESPNSDCGTGLSEDEEGRTVTPRSSDRSSSISSASASHIARNTWHVTGTATGINDGTVITPSGPKRRKNDSSGEFQPQGNDDANEHYGSGEDTNAEKNDETLVTPATFKDELDKQHKAMKNQHKLFLPSSNRYAEDIMYQYCKAADAETAFKSLCGHWILDLDWAAKSKVFRDAELEDLCKMAVDALPDLPEGYDYIFGSFDTEDIKAFEIALSKLATDQLHPNERYQEHSRSTANGMDQATRYWLIHALTGWSCLEKQRSTSDRPEAWWTHNVWASVFERLMQTIDDVVVQRGETVSSSTTLRKNENRDYASKGGSLWGRRTDACVVVDGKWEYAVIQAAKSLANGPVDTKYCSDYWKLARNLKDMIWALQQSRGKTVAQIGVQLIGLLEQGPEWHIFGDLLEILKWSVRIHRFVKELHPWIGRQLKKKNSSHDPTFPGMFANQNSPRGKETSQKRRRLKGSRGK